jgi:serine/threonine-protein phosphatase 2A regulatory subunit B''
MTSRADLIVRLKAFNASRTNCRSKNQEEAEVKALIDRATGRDVKHQLRVPVFLPRKNNITPKESKNAAKHLLRVEASLSFMKKQTARIPQGEELNICRVIMEENSSPPLESDGEPKVNYEDFLKIKELVPERCRNFFRASIFMYFTPDEHQRISVSAFCEFIAANAKMQQDRIRLSFYDRDEDGRLTENELNEFIGDHLETIPSVQKIIQSFPMLKTIYTWNAARNIFFFLDPYNKGYIRICDFLGSPFFLQLEKLDEIIFAPNEKSNWFSMETVNRVYRKFLALDKTESQSLAPYELQGYCSGLTNAFITRLFQERPCPNGRMEYNEFLTFVLAMENKNTWQSIHYFFPIFDLQKRGYLTISDLNYFLRDVLEGLDMTIDSAEESIETSKILREDVKDQIFDMVRPKCPLRITRNDLIHSGVGEVFINILTDKDLFDTWDEGVTDSTSDDPQQQMHPIIVN